MEIVIDRNLDGTQATNNLTFTDGENFEELSINDDAEITDLASIVAAISFAGGIDVEQVRTSVDMVLAGADPESVAYLMLALKEILDSDEVDTAMLAFAIDTFNQIVNDADLGTITGLNELPGFLDIREVLMARNPSPQS